MKYEQIKPAVFDSRPNRFLAHVNLDGKIIVCHVKNTGRCRELLVPNAEILVQYHPNANALGRKTAYSLIGVYKKTDLGIQLVNMDSQAPNQVAAEWLATGGISGITQIRREVRYGNSRFDLAFLQDETPAFMEVKGVTLETNGIARFPDAPTERGIKHLEELAKASAEGYRAYVLFVIAMKGVNQFEPNMQTHPAFGQALARAAKSGVQVLAYDCNVTFDSLTVDAPIPVLLP